MTATIFELSSAEHKLQKGYLVTSTELFEQMILWEISSAFGPDTKDVITDLSSRLKLDLATADTRYGWLHTDEENSELVFYRKDEISRRMCIMKQ